MSETFPVTVEVNRPDGSVEQVRVGSATRQGDGFALQLGGLRIGGTPEARRPSFQLSSGNGAAGGGDGMVFPNYGRSKNQPIVGATMQDLEYYANGSRRSLNDPSKSRWHEKEKVLLAAIEAEIARQGGGAAGGGDSFGGGFGGGSSGEPPPHGDDDIPF